MLARTMIRHRWLRLFAFGFGGSALASLAMEGRVEVASDLLFAIAVTAGFLIEERLHKARRVYTRSR